MIINLYANVQCDHRIGFLGLRYMDRKEFVYFDLNNFTHDIMT